MALCQASGIAHLLSIDLSVIRGLSYYTGTVWSCSMPAAPCHARSAVAAATTPAGELRRRERADVGFGFGDVVITDILSERACCPSSAAASMTWSIPSAQSNSRSPPAWPRPAPPGPRGDRRLHLPALPPCHRAAEKDGAKRLIVLGGNEVRDGVCQIRHLGARSARSAFRSPTWWRLSPRR